MVVSSEPPAAAELSIAPGSVTIRFNSRIDHARSLLQLIGPEGRQLTLDIAAAGEPTVVTAPVPASPPMAPGAWRLRWQVLAIDGHITRGDIPFTVQGR